MSDTPLLQLRDITKSFGSVHALAGVDFEVNVGEVMALVGDNGAGKSTLIKCIAGTHAADSGQILFEGREVHIHGPKDAGRLGIEVVYQDLALCDNLDVVENMYLGRELNRLQLLSEAPLEQRTSETLATLAVTTIRRCASPSRRSRAASGSRLPSRAPSCGTRSSSSSTSRRLRSASRRPSRCSRWYGASASKG